MRPSESEGNLINIAAATRLTGLSPFEFRQRLLADRSPFHLVRVPNGRAMIPLDDILRFLNRKQHERLAD